MLPLLQQLPLPLLLQPKHKLLPPLNQLKPQLKQLLLLLKPELPLKLLQPRQRLQLTKMEGNSLL